LSLCGKGVRCGLLFLESFRLPFQIGILGLDFRIGCLQLGVLQSSKNLGQVTHSGGEQCLLTFFFKSAISLFFLSFTLSADSISLLRAMQSV